MARILGFGCNRDVEASDEVLSSGLIQTDSCQARREVGKRRRSAKGSLGFEETSFLVFLSVHEMHLIV